MEKENFGPMAGKTVLVTGATSGIGRATALGLAQLGAHVAITGRDTGRTEGAAREIRAAVGGKVDVFVADLSAQSQVRILAAQVLHDLPRLDVLVNNAGGYWNTRHVTADGLERTFAVNHLAPFLLTNLLLDRLRQSGSARVVTVSSNAQAMGRIDFDDLQGDSFGAEDPGRTQRLLLPFARPFMKTPTEGAATSIRAASAAELDAVTGGFHANGKPKRSTKRSYDVETATRLWQVSDELVGLTVAT